jgi:hypothetical protein
VLKLTAGNNRTNLAHFGRYREPPRRAAHGTHRRIHGLR